MDLDRSTLGVHVNQARSLRPQPELLKIEPGAQSSLQRKMLDESRAAVGRVVLVVGVDERFGSPLR